MELKFKRWISLVGFIVAIFMVSFEEWFGLFMWVVCIWLIVLCFRVEENKVQNKESEEMYPNHYPEHIMD